MFVTLHAIRLLSYLIVLDHHIHVSWYRLNNGAQYNILETYNYICSQHVWGTIVQSIPTYMVLQSRVLSPNLSCVYGLQSQFIIDDDSCFRPSIQVFLLNNRFLGCIRGKHGCASYVERLICMVTSSHIEKRCFLTGTPKLIVQPMAQQT